MSHQLMGLLMLFQSSKAWPVAGPWYRLPADPRPLQVFAPSGDDTLTSYRRTCLPGFPECEINGDLYACRGDEKKCSAHCRNLSSPDVASLSSALATHGDGSCITKTKVEVNTPLLHTLLDSHQLKSSERSPEHLRPLIYINTTTYQRNRKRFRYGQSPDSCNCEPWQLTDFVPTVYEIWLEGAAEHALPPLHRRVLNVGANDGSTDDPLKIVVRKHKLSGYFIEPQDQHWDALCKHLGGLGFDGPEPIKAFLTTSNFVDVLPEIASYVLDSDKRYSLDILKMDIDSNDCKVLEEALRWVAPTILIMEVLPIPPPLRYVMHVPGESAVWGCSLSYLVELLAGYDLFLWKYSGQDSIFLDRALLSHIRGNTAAKAQDLASDEFECFRTVDVHAPPDLPVSYLQDWFFNVDWSHTDDVRAGLADVRGNFSLWKPLASTAQFDVTIALPFRFKE